MRRLHSFQIAALTFGLGLGATSQAGLAARGGEIPNTSAMFTPFEDGVAPITPRSLLRPHLPQPLNRVLLSEGGLSITPPQGYCVDPSSAQSGAFAVIASCRALSEGAEGASVEPVMVTVTVGPPAGPDDMPSPAAMADAVKASVLWGLTRNGFMSVHLASGGERGMKGGDARHWRGAFLHGGRMIGLALYAPEGSPLAGDAGGALLARVRAGIKTAENKQAGDGGDAQTPEGHAHP